MKPVDRLEWLGDAQRTLPGDFTAQAVAVALVRHVNGKTGQCNPSYQTLANDIGSGCRETVKKAVARLRKSGLVKYQGAVGGARQSTNQYTLTRVSRYPPKTTDPGTAIPGYHGYPGTVPPSDPGTPVPPNTVKNTGDDGSAPKTRSSVVSLEDRKARVKQLRELVDGGES